MHFRCVFTLLLCCVQVGLDWAEPTMHLYLHVTCSCIFMHTYLQFFIFWYIFLLVLFWLSLYFPLSLFLVWAASWHPNANLLRPRTLCVLGHLLPLILHLILFGFVMRKLVRTSRRTSLDEAFIQNAKSFCLISLTLHFPLSSTVGVGSHFMAPRSLVPSWSFRSSTPTCMDLILQYLCFLLVFKVRALWSLRYCIWGTPCPEGSASWLPRLWLWWWWWWGR